ncbi:hypothetical protein EH2_00031 [Bacillus subtilis]|uniref:Uncharacterized protein n=1 Tax=Bacillus subtilis TaxID=1423 RepID=A0AAP1EF54_BACIU|nr:hypothetical protein B4146_2029 [Bacillus subtilis]KZD95223.1 hypothetical protein B4122_0195 [Bacillus subtilis]RPK20738.1 hypothetical protein EH2_00031 [Bacillus subtilis]
MYYIFEKTAGSANLRWEKPFLKMRRVTYTTKDSQFFLKPF